MGLFSSLFKGSKKKPEPTEKPTKKKAPTPKEPYVYVTTKGKKFHYSRVCPGLRHSKEYKMLLSKARKAGYTACDKCEKYQYIEDYELL